MTDPDTCLKPLSAVSDQEMGGGERVDCPPQSGKTKDEFINLHIIGTDLGFRGGASTKTPPTLIFSHILSDAVSVRSYISDLK